MKVSLNTIKSFIDFELPPVDELVQRINQQLGGVEEVVNLAEKYKDALIVKVVECEKHPNADRLNVCKIDTGSGELVQVVCGAPNVHADMWAVWLPPSSIVPSTYGTNEPFILGMRELRGVMSSGMLAAGDELAINSDHDGIIELTTRDMPQDVAFDRLTPGQSFAEVFGLGDTIIDIENKMFTHRPDLFGQLGVAREIAGIFGHAFHDPKWYYELDEVATEDELRPLQTFNEAGDKSSRFMALVMKNVTVGPSPLWLQTTLLRWGGKSINNVVDATNYIMFLTAQPTHAYDYDKLHGAMLGVRMAQQGEQVKLLNGKTYELDDDDIVIVDGKGVVGLAGIMGGVESEVDINTKNIVLEVANFDMYAVRKSSMKYGLFTDALTRFNKGQSMLMNSYVLQQLTRFMSDLAGAEPAGVVHDDLVEGEQWRAKPSVTPMLGGKTISAQFINDRLGLKLAATDIANLLTNVGFECTEKSDELSYWAPAWRMDIQDPEDVVEEVGRLYGFDKLPRVLPTKSITPASKNVSRVVAQHIRDSLSRGGANEVLTYSFVHEQVLKKAGQDPRHAYKLSNALSPDLHYYRLSLTPSLLDKVRMNSKAGYGAFALYEINKVHYKSEMDPADPDVPNEHTHVAMVIAYRDKQRPEGSPYFVARRYAEQLLSLDDVELVPMVQFDMANDERGAQLTAPYEPLRSAVIVRDGTIWGVVGEFAASVVQSFKLPACTAGFELHTDLIELKRTQYQPLSRFPSTTQDISLRGAPTVAYQQVRTLIERALREKSGDMRVGLEPISIYRSDDGQKTTSLRLTFTSYERTLKDEDIAPIMDDIAARSLSELNLERI